MCCWVRGQGAKLVLEAFEIGAFGGPATEPFRSAKMELPTTRTRTIEECQKATEDWERELEKERRALPGTNATNAERRSYVGKALAAVWGRNPPVDAAVPYAGDMGWVLSTWLPVLEVYGPDALGPESESRARRQTAVVANAIDSEADLIVEGDDPAFRHSDDFRSVVWSGTSYTFTRNQASCVKVLWAAWKTDTPELDGVTVVTQANVTQTRLIDVFKAKGRMHPAWGTMITNGSTKGAYRLSETATVAKSALKLRRKKSRKTPRKTPR